MKEIIKAYNLRDKFSAAVKRNCDVVCHIDKEDYKGRLDLRHENTFTIDGADSRDFDDAVTIKKDGGGFVLGVHIADVAHYVHHGSPLDKEAFLRGTSVYFPHMVLPMLPEALSNGVCSLNPHEDRLALSVIMNIDCEGNVVSHEIHESVINSKERLTYAQADEIIKSGKKHDLKEMHDLTKLLLKKRQKRGALEIESNEAEIDVGIDGKVLELKRKQRLISHDIIEEFMVLCNSVVAEHYLKKGLPFIYRTHAKPPIEKVERLKNFLKPLGIKYSGSFSKLIDSVSEEQKPVISQMVLRSMAKAEYLPKCTGHYGLKLDYYSHFTSPIRRYADLCIHRVIKADMHGEKIKGLKRFVIEAAKQSSLTERTAEDAERKVDDIFIASYMQAFIGEEFDGIVSGVCPHGIYVTLDNTAEGLIKVSSLKGYYTFDDSALTMSGEFIFRMGQKVRIRLHDAYSDRIDFTFVPTNDMLKGKHNKQKSRQRRVRDA